MTDFPGQTVVDTLILAIVTTGAVVSCGYIALMWNMRSNFFIRIRSPMLTCAVGLALTYRYVSQTFEYVFLWRGDDIGEEGIVEIVGLPALLTAEAALILTAIRLLVMYYPRKRAKYGAWIREKPLMWSLAGMVLVVEAALLLLAWRRGVSRAATVTAMLRPASIALTLVAAVWLGTQLQNVQDSTNLSRDIRLVGRILVPILILFAAIRLAPMSDVAYKYANIGFVLVVIPPLLYVIIVRPVREVLRPVPRSRRNSVQLMLIPAPMRRRPSSSGVTDDGTHSTASEGRAVCVGENQLASIMSFPPLRQAFGEFCRKALCSESFEFLIQVSGYRNRDSGAGDEDSAHDFAIFLAIVNSYVKPASHSEINIGSVTRSGIMKYTTADAYNSLELGMRKEIFREAEEEIGNLLAYNLLNKFLASDQYKAVMDVQGVI